MTTTSPSNAPVFIVGQARSGSSILYRLVQEHPRFRPSAGLNLSESHVLSAVVDEPTFDTPSLRAFAGLDDDGWQRLTNGLRTVEPRRRVAVRIPNRLLQRNVRLWCALGCAATVRAYVAHATTGRGAERLVEKTPQHLPWARHLATVFPESPMLVITRHPVPAYASFRRRAAEDPDAPWAAMSPSAFAARWAADVAHLAALMSRHGDRVRVERYEQLVAEPDGVQSALFRWLGEPPLDELPGEVEANPHAPTADAAQLFGAVQDLGRDWTEHVSPDDAGVIENAVAGPMALLGYRPAVR